jgi:hypothetical protein
MITRGLVLAGTLSVQRGRAADVDDDIIDDTDSTSARTDRRGSGDARVMTWSYHRRRLSAVS